MEIIRFKDSDQLKTEAREAFITFIAEQKEKPVLILASGGSSLEILSGINPFYLGPRLTVGMLDERFDQNSEVNNFTQLTKTKFYQAAKDKNVLFIDTRPGMSESLEELTARFEESLKAWRSENPDGAILITQGIGEDGHTAGILPYPEDPDLFQSLFDREGKWVAGYDATLAKNPYPQRVTVTLPFLRYEVNKAIVYVRGDNKKEALARVLAGKEKLWEVPARIVHHMKSAIIFTDIV